MNTLITGKAKFYSQTQNKEYIQLLRKYPAFKPEEELAVFKRLQSGDKTAVDEIVKHNQRWVYSLAKEYARDEIEVMDYVNEGNLGLLQAIEAYNVDAGFKFITFAVWYIRRSMNYYLMNTRDVIAKSNNAKLFKKIERVKSDFLVRNGYQPSIDDIKAGLYNKYGITIKDDSDLYDLEIRSINEGVSDDSTYEESNEFIKATAYDDSYNSREDEKDCYTELVMPVLNYLPEDNREFIKKIYHIGYDESYTRESICEEYGYDDDGLKAMETKILRYMKQRIKLNELKKEIIAKTEKKLQCKNVTIAKRNEVLQEITEFFDSCFNGYTKNAEEDKPGTIEETMKKIGLHIANVLKELEDVKVVI